MNRLKSSCGAAVLAVLCLLAVLPFGSCKYPDTPPNPNAPPVTRLSNIPPPQDTVQSKNPRMTLNWVGDDPDGYVVGFRYRWTINSLRDPNNYKPYSTILNIIVQGFALMVDTDDPTKIPAVYKYFATLPPEGLDLTSVDVLKFGDSLSVAGYHVWASNSDFERVPNTNPIQRTPRRFPVHVNPNSGTFIFDSPDSLNLHTFEVEAIDNLGAASKDPARVSFDTPIVQPPETNILSGPNDTSLVTMNITPTFAGIHFQYIGVDPNSRTIDYQVAVDGDQYDSASVPWTKFTTSQDVYFAAGAFKDPFASTHQFWVRARNEFGAVDPTPAVAIFHTIYPAFARAGYTQRILFVNSAYDSGGVEPWYPSRAQLTAWYAGIFSDLGLGAKVDYWSAGDDPPDGPGFPTRDILQNYSLVIMTADRGNFQGIIDPKLSVGREVSIIEYTSVGGKFMLGGWAMRSNTNKAPFDQFDLGVLHIGNATLGLAVQANDCLGPRGALGYPDLTLDTTKLAPWWGGALAGQWMVKPSGFGEIIYTFDAQSNFAAREGQPFGIRYLGVTFDCVFFPFPLYYMERSGAVETLRKAFSDMGELNRP